MARLSLDDALIELEERFGPRLESWRWGDAHQALHLHQTLGRVPVLRHLVNIRQSTPGGDQTLLRGQTPADGPEPYLNVHAAGFRGGLRLLRPGFERLHHRHRRERAPAVAALRRPGGDLAAVGVHPDVARPGPGAGRSDGGDAAAAGRRRSGAGRGPQRMMRLYLAPARLASAMRPF